MKEIKFINGYIFDSSNYMDIDNSMVHKKVEDMSMLLNAKIDELEIRLNELKDAREFIKTGKQIYLIKNNNSEYGYVDTNGKNYEYNQIKGKPILIDQDFNVYEIIEYVDLDNIGQDKGTSYCVKSWIDKIVKVKLISQSR